MPRSPHLKRPANPKEVEERVAFIANKVGHGGTADEQQAHALEDELYQDVLHMIAHDLCDDPAGCAREALRTQRLAFQRRFT